MCGVEKSQRDAEKRAHPSAVGAQLRALHAHVGKAGPNI